MACITPYQKMDKKHGINISVPCGKCPPCLKRRTSGWSFRLRQEGRRCTSASFVTLTYDSAKLPEDSFTKNKFLTLNKRHVQLFFKKLRFAHGQSQIKYYAVGEYGTKSWRPHYHILLFNADLRLVQPAWEYGAIHYGEITDASIGYCLKYMTKEGKIPQHQNDDRQKEFSLMSKGLGSNYLTPSMAHYHKSDLTQRMHCVLPDGKKIAMPRYYKEKIYTESERKIIGWQAIEDNIKREADYWQLMEKLHGDRAVEVSAQTHIDSFNKMHKNGIENRNKI
ncbi:replication initiator protein [Blackfly microvirus SF02]|uniref:Replication initiator protein n=1 Tax=Blackfly microvirus SF02 TaxID=2576452 RepID=A0A4P8PKP0_9VIRU|nr:replication initiator protein [Blackfly microvirus SF02]